MITVKARLEMLGDAAGESSRSFQILELKAPDGDDLTNLVGDQHVFRSLEELDAFLTLRLAREARAQIAD